MRVLSENNSRSQRSPSILRNSAAAGAVNCANYPIAARQAPEASLYARASAIWS